MVARSTELFPKSMSIFCIYARLLVKQGRKQEAIAAFLRGGASVQNESADSETKARWTADIEKDLRDLGWTPG